MIMPPQTRPGMVGRPWHPCVALSAAFLALSLLPHAAPAAMLIRAYEPKRHDRFYADVDKAFVGQSFDWSGVGKTHTGKWVTMVSPSYFLSAAHLAPGAGELVTFYEENDRSHPHTYVVADGGLRIPGDAALTDLWLGRLTTPLDPGDHIRYYPILRLDDDARYVDQEIFNYGKVDRVGRNVVEGILEVTAGGSTGMCMIFDYDDDDVIDVGGDETYLQSGDSGGPSFASWNGELVLLGIHWINGHLEDGTWFSGDTFVPPYIDAIQAHMYGETLTIVPAPAMYVFYNNSAWDGKDAAANELDDSAIAWDKRPLRHGERATFANYTSYSKGINGLMIDMYGLRSTPTAQDFLFRQGNDNAPYGLDLDDPGDDWPWAPDPITITVRPGAGWDGADRVTLIWPDNVLRKCWLQVTVLATDATRLTRDEVFYVGNAVGDSGNSTIDTAVNVLDALGVRANTRTLLRPASIDNRFDFNRDRQVNVLDELIVRANLSTRLSDLNLIDLTAYGGP